MTAEHPEDPTCPRCGKPARCVLEVRSVGSGSDWIHHGEACLESDAGAGNTNWKIYVH